MGDKDYKYRINDLLDKLSVKDNKKAINMLPAELGIGAATFNNYRAIGLDDKQDIPHTIVVKLEQFFGIAPGELQNFTVDVQPINKPYSGQRQNKTELGKKFQLSQD